MSNIRCSFCTVTLRDSGAKMIAGPKGIYVCFDCVRLLDEIKHRDPGGQVHDLTAMDTPDASARRVRELESAIRAISNSIAKVISGPHAITCMWCDAPLDNSETAREHVATCEKHPAVIALRGLQRAGGSL